MKQEAEAEIAKFQAKIHALQAEVHATLRDGMESVEAEVASIDQKLEFRKDSHDKNHAPLLFELINNCYECIAMFSKLYEANLKQARNHLSIKDKCKSLIENNRRFRQMYKDGNYAMMKSQMKSDAVDDEDFWG